MTISKGIPLPTQKHRKYFPQLEVGDSFLLRDYCKDRPAAYYIANREGWTFTIRQVEENGKLVDRVWRVK